MFYLCCRPKVLPAVRVSLSTSNNQGNPTMQLAFWFILDPVKLMAQISHAIGLGKRE